MDIWTSTKYQIMETPFYKSAGASLSIGSTLAIIVMTLHPSGGSIDHIIQIEQLLIFTHALAICCLPFILFGFYGVSRMLLDKRRLSMLAFLVSAFGLIAAMLAALFNGLALPFFLSRYSDDLEQNMNHIEAILQYGFAINTALDYVFIVALCAAIALYSLLILSSQKLPKWMGYLGIVILILAIIGAATGFMFTSLAGFRIFVFCIAAWILSVGITLMRLKE
jgi:hypothetical protein